MRNYKNFVRPHGDLKKIKDALHQYFVNRGVNKELLYGGWRQYVFTDLFSESEEKEIRERWVRAISKVVGIDFKPEEFSFVLHTGRDSVDTHTDGLAKTSFLVPLRVSPTIKFYEDWSSILLHKAQLLRFNDSNSHGLDNPHLGEFEILSISRDLA